MSAVSPNGHPGNVSFDELSQDQKSAVARGWNLDPGDSADVAAVRNLFDTHSPKDRWSIITASSQTDSSYEREVERVTANADPATNEAFGIVTAAPTGDLVLAEVECYLTQFVAYPSEAACVAHTLWVAHTHLMHLWESTPRIAFLSPEPGSGKSRALEVSEPLVPRPVHAVNATPAYLFRKVSDEAGPPTILFDEIDTVFGPRAKDNEEVRGLLNAGHRRGAVAGRCVVKGRTVVTEELPAYCAVALAGLDDLPDTLMSRSVVVRMRRRSPSEKVEPFRHRLHAPEGHEIRADLEEWAATFELAWPTIPDGVIDRDADVWEPLLAIAESAGEFWTKRARVAAVALVADSRSAPPSIGVRLLGDIRAVFGDAEHLSTEDLLAALIALEESPWGDIRGKELDARSLSRRLAKYGVKPKTVRIGDRTPKGYSAADLADPWSRYLPNVADVADIGKESLERITTELVGNESDAVGWPPKGSATSATPQQAELEGV